MLEVYGRDGALKPSPLGGATVGALPLCSMGVGLLFYLRSLIQPNHTVFEWDTSMCRFHGCYHGSYRDGS